MGDKSKLKIGTYQNPNSGRSKESIDKYVRGMREKKYGGKKINTDRIRKFKTGMTPGQAKIAAKAPPPNKIDEKDFKVLREEKAKGRGMGLQDESVQPGKVMKAKKGKMASDRDRRQKELIKKQNPISEYDRKGKLKYTAAKMGKSIKADPTKTITDKGQFVKRRMKLAGSKLPGRIGTALGIGAMMVPAAYAAAKQYKDYKSAKNRDEAKVKKMGGGMMKKYSKGSEKKLMTPEERAAYVKKAKVSLKATAESLQDKLHPKKSDRLFSKHKKMGGGMMQKPMGYKSGMGPAGAAGPSAGRPGGRRPMQQGPKGGIGSLPKKRSDDLVILVNSGDGKIKKIKRSEFEDNMSAPKQKMGGGMMKRYSKGGGADTGTVGEYKSKIGVLSNKLRRQGMRLTRPDIEKLKGIAGKQGAANLVKRSLDILESSKKMGGGMMQKPMGYSKGVSVKARGCKLGRTRPTKIT